MNASAASRILLVRAVEERAPELVPPDAIAEADLEAGPVVDEALWFTRRAEHLIERLPESLATLLGMPRAVHGGLLVYFLATAALGLATNYLGPARSIHAVYNPIVVLIVWNLAVYVVLVTGSPVLARRLRSWRGPRLRTAGSEPAALPPRRRSRSVFRWLLRRSIPALWLRVQKATSDSRQEAAQLGVVAKRFWELWGELERPLFGVAARRIASVCALGLATGAILGMFVRGLFFDYHVVWRSTFVTDPASIGAILKVFALPALLVGQPIPGAEEGRLLLQPGGVPAASWMTLYAAAAALFIGVPRLAMIVFHSLRLRFLEAKLDLLGDPYFEEVIRPARAQRVDEIAAAIRTDVRVEAGRFSEGIATWVCESLYDGSIVPAMRAFREQGGRLRDLEAEITSRCEKFRPELEAYFTRALEDLHRSLSVSVARTIGADVKFQPTAATGLQDEVLGTSRGAAERGGASLGRDFELVAVSSVSGAMALIAGALSGGFGHTLGTAILVSLLGTTGPVGFLLGALLGLVAAGGAYFVGRDKASAALESVKLPGPVVRMVFRPKRFEGLIQDGRRRCHDAVAQSIQEHLDPLAAEISEQIWSQVKPVLVKRQRGLIAQG